MAKLKGPLMSMTAKKQLGHELIFKMKKNRAFVTGYSRPGRKNPAPASPAQLDKRMIYNLIIARWQTMSAGEKDIYNNLVKNKNLNMSGWNYFYSVATKDLPQYLGLQGYWSFNKIVAGKILDLSGNGNDGLLKPSYPSNAPKLVDSKGKKFGKAGNFDGVDDWINCGNNDSLSFPTNSSFTIEGLFKLGTLQTGWRRALLTRELYLVNGYRLGVDLNGVSVSFWTSQSGGNLQLSTSGITFEINRYYNIAVTFKNQQAYIYIDGIERGNSVGTFIGGSSTLRLGGGMIDFFEGDMDEIRIWNRELSAEEIQKHYKLISSK